MYRRNKGFDFGAWHHAFAEGVVPDDGTDVLLINSSLVGPFSNIRPLLTACSGSAMDVVGITRSQQHKEHLQSYWLYFKRDAIQGADLPNYLAGACDIENKQEIIEKFELPLSRHLHRCDLTYSPLFPIDEMVSRRQSPAIVGWEPLMRAGFPFIKRELLRRPYLVSRPWRIPDVIRELYGVELGEVEPALVHDFSYNAHKRVPRWFYLARHPLASRGS